MRTLFLLVATTALLLMTAVPAQAQDIGIKNPDVSTPTTLYFHVINVQDMPINTQLPDPEFSQLGSFGPGTNTLKCLDPTTNQATGGSTSQVFHTNYGYSSPSYVEYDYQNANGDPRVHPERGISYDAVFDKATPFILTYYVVSYVGQPGADQIPVPTPKVVVAATMRAGDAISVDDAGYDGGPVIAAGATAPVVLLPGGPNAQPPYSNMPGPTTDGGAASTEVFYEGPTPDGRHLYRFDVNMGFQADVVQRATGFNVRIDIYMDTSQTGQCTQPTEKGKEYIMLGTIAPWTDAEHRPQMNFNIVNPIRLEYLHPQFVGDELVVHTSMNSAWGNYDVGEVNAKLTPQVTADYIQVKIDGPSPATSLAPAAMVQRFHEHYHHQEAVDVTYVWPYKTDHAENGQYTVFVSFKNDQGTAEATGTATFDVGKGTVVGCGGVQEASQKLTDDCAETIQTDGADQTADAPGVPLVGALAAIGAAAVLMRRRKA